MKSVIFDRIIGIISSESGYEVRSILGKNKSCGLSDCRSMAAYFLYYTIGFNMATIAGLMGLSVSGVSYHVIRASERRKQSYAFRSVMDKSANLIRNEMIN